MAEKGYAPASSFRNTVGTFSSSSSSSSSSEPESKRRSSISDIGSDPRSQDGFVSLLTRNAAAKLKTDRKWGEFFNAVSTHTIRHVVAAASVDDLNAIVDAVTKFKFSGPSNRAQVARLIAVLDGLGGAAGDGLNPIMAFVKGLPTSVQVEFLEQIEKKASAEENYKPEAFLDAVKQGFEAVVVRDFSQTRSPDPKLGHGAPPLNVSPSDVIAGNLIYTELAGNGPISDATIEGYLLQLKGESPEMIRSVTLGILQALPKSIGGQLSRGAGLEAFQAMFQASPDTKHSTGGSHAAEIVKTAVAFFDDPTTSEAFGIAILVDSFGIDEKRAEALVKANRRAFLAAATLDGDVAVERGKGEFSQRVPQGSVEKVASEADNQLVAPSPPGSAVDGNGGESSSKPSIVPLGQFTDEFIFRRNTASIEEWLRYDGPELQ